MRNQIVSVARPLYQYLQTGLTWAPIAEGLLIQGEGSRSLDEATVRSSARLYITGL